MKGLYTSFNPKVMKTLHGFAVFALLVGFAFVTSGMASNRHRQHIAKEIVANVDLTLQNKCTRDAKYKTTFNGATQEGVVLKGDKMRLSLAEGTKIVVDGEDFMTVTAADNGQTFQVCR